MRFKGSAIMSQILCFKCGYLINIKDGRTGKHECCCLACQIKMMEDSKQ